MICRYTARSPLECEIRSVRLIGSNDSDRSFYHVVIDHKGRYKFESGQYCGILPPGRLLMQTASLGISGISERTKRAHSPRSYSLAPVLEEDEVDPSSCFSLGIRAPFITPTNKSSFRGICICSQYLSGASPGTTVRVTGPFGKFLLAPDDLQGKRNLLLVATGTGIVPYMGFLNDLLKASSQTACDFGRILLVFGVQSPSTFIYRTKIEEYISKFKGRLDVISCYSRYGPISDRCYVQVRFQRVFVTRSQDKILMEQDLLKAVCCAGGRECSIFICGRKSMEEDVLNSLRTVFAGRLSWDSFLKNIKVEVY
ncbi:oxidoreductase NAD-binding domain containing protein [Babesia caballi]|uniref:ferredoxin--NADP(+) reductase n=1 Tax=Babesia caballi TaxID=5871 RepID=A0AAV4LRY3_BABCB|nr:oxidoreductase NAD-binding domain containing protein [Babesia caballi]